MNTTPHDFFTPTLETPSARAARLEYEREVWERWEALTPAEKAKQIAAVVDAEGGPCDCAACHEPTDS